MHLRKSPAQTPAFLIGNRAKARKGTGPRIAALNALKQDRCAAAFRPVSEPVTDRGQYQAERLAAIVWTRTRKKPRPGTNPESPLSSRHAVPMHPWLSRIQIVHRLRRVGLDFWVQRRKYWTLQRMLEALFNGVP